MISSVISDLLCSFLLKIFFYLADSILNLLGPREFLLHVYKKHIAFLNINSLLPQCQRLSQWHKLFFFIQSPPTYLRTCGITLPAH
jgi:hypothetical protein